MTSSIRIFILPLFYRDSTIYGDLYGIREAHTLLRGTLRYAGTNINFVFSRKKNIYILLQKNEVLWF